MEVLIVANELVVGGQPSELGIYAFETFNAKYTAGVYKIKPNGYIRQSRVLQNYVNSTVTLSVVVQSGYGTTLCMLSSTSTVCMICELNSGINETRSNVDDFNSYDILIQNKSDIDLDILFIGIQCTKASLEDNVNSLEEFTNKCIIYGLEQNLPSLITGGTNDAD